MVVPLEIFPGRLCHDSLLSMQKSGNKNKMEKTQKSLKIHQRSVTKSHISGHVIHETKTLNEESTCHLGPIKGMLGAQRSGVSRSLKGQLKITRNHNVWGDEQTGKKWKITFGNTQIHIKPATRILKQHNDKFT
ncbi:hypothetical protein fugu_001692 [Takifugu bimaculatus]|uniref:Uncharacterized protein n=1 Tax=Takifugu bimaculatus TaxID=433685 RepID=A0A4Z2BPM6_9TELE|nr:hypothetical protein fugu_001692 [Takifugu bimaculatus]